MQATNSWDLLLAEEYSAKPFGFVAGLRHFIGKDYYCPFHSHPNLEIVYHASGAGRTSTLHETEAEFTVGAVVIYAPQRSHDQTMTEDGEDVCLQIALPARLAAKLPSLFQLPKVSVRQAEELEYLASLRSRPDGIERRIESFRATALLLDLIRSGSEATSETRRSPSLRRVQRAKEYIDGKFAEIESLEQVAKHAGVSHDRLRHLFREATGKSLVRYLNETRLARACILLANSPMALQQVAAACGYKDEYYFSAVFKRFMKIPPGAYRFRHLGAETAPRKRRGRIGKAV